MSGDLEGEIKRTLEVIEGLFSLLDHGLQDVIVSDVPRIFSSGKQLEEFYSSLLTQGLTSEFEEKMVVFFSNRGHLVRPSVSRLERVCDRLLLKFIALNNVELIKCGVSTYVRLLSVERMIGAVDEAAKLRRIYTSLCNQLSPEEASLLESSFVLTSWVKSYREDMSVDLNLDLRISEMLENETSLQLLLNMLLLTDSAPPVVRIKNKIFNAIKTKVERQSKLVVLLLSKCANEHHFRNYPDLLNLLMQTLKSVCFLMRYSPETESWSGEEGFTYEEIINILRSLMSMKSHSKQVISYIRQNKTVNEPCIWIDIERSLKLS